MKKTNERLLLILIVSILLLSFAAISFALTFTGKGCNGNQVCDTKTECDLLGNCNTEYSNCVSCGTTTKSCTGGIASCDNKCEQVGSAAQCKTCTPDCSNLQIRISEPHVVLKFNVFTKKNFITGIEPKSQTALAGTTQNYKVSIENKHPKAIALNLAVEVPTGWASNVVSNLQMSANSKRDITFTVTSNTSASDGSYPITFVVFSYELAMFDTITAEYVVASRGAPTISINPSTQEGAPGESLKYIVTVTNNDPQDFDPSTISLVAYTPKDWTASFDKATLKLNPGESGSSVMSVKSSATADLATYYTITVNATANKLSASGFVEYKLTFCGNGVCELDENCEKDCIPETDIICNGRCEKEVDDGLEFSATVNFMFTEFVICNKNSKPSECLSAYESGNCGYGEKCLCGNNLIALCKMRCVDKKGAYYLYAKDGNEARSKSNYSFACPFVNLREIILIKSNMSIAKAKYEQAKSAFNETIKMNASERMKLQPCIDALGLIIKNLTAHVSYLENVIENPAKSNTTEARRRNDAIRSFIEVTYNKYCRGAEGLLRIESLAPPSATEKNRVASANVVVKNHASFDYYGYLECDFVPPGGNKIVTKEACTLIPPLESEVFNPSINVSYDGDWKMKCRVYASLEPDCSTEIHDETDYYTFSVYSKDIYVVDVSGVCRTNDISCSVRTNALTQCIGCRVGSTECTKSGQNGTTTYFTCPKASFYSNVVGYVYSSSMCNPVGPNEKNITVHCPGCGDNITQSGEQCELPNTDNSIKCMQAENTCDGKRAQYRDRYGFCTPSCQCSADQYQSECRKNVCGAVCSDGETKNKTITSLNKTCVCVQECNATCEWGDCYCEPVPPPELPGVEVLGVSVSDSCPEEKSYIDVWCALSEARVNCMKAKIGNTICEWNNNSYWYGNNAVFKDCAVGLKTNTACSADGRSVTCYIDRTKCNQIGANMTIGIDVLPKPVPTTPSVPCNVRITSRNCSYDPVANRYNVYLGISWSGGSYSKGKIDDTESRKYTISNFIYSSQSGSAGTKQLTASVYDTNDNLLCANTSDVYCTPEIIGPTITNTSVEILGISVSDSCPEEKTYIDVVCTSSIPKVDCIRAKVGNTICEWTNSSYWYGNEAVFKDCAAGFKTNTACGNQSRQVRCYIDKTRCSQVGGDKVLGIDVATAAEKPKAACGVEITSKSCAYDPLVKRYTAAMSVKWSNGDHAHAKIAEDDESKKITTPEFTYTYQFGLPEMKTLKAYVHDSNDRVLCYNTSNIYCGQGNTTGIVLDVIRNMPDVTRPGWINVKFDIIPYKPIQNFELLEYVRRNLSVINRTMEGNVSATIFGGPSTIAERNREYHVYSWKTDLGEKNATISYKIRVDEEGEYHFLAKAKFFDQEIEKEKYLFVTSCPQTTPVLARNQAGDCKQFKTSCDAAKMGYEIVETCIEPPPYTLPEEEFDWFSLVIVIIIAAILAFIWVKREEIKEKIDEWRQEKEEEPSGIKIP